MVKEINNYFGSSLLIIILSVLFLQFFSGTSEQSSDTPSKNDNGVRVIVPLFGVDDQTGRTFTFVKVDNFTQTRIINASSENVLRNGTGVVDMPFLVANQTVQFGEKLIACVVVLNIPQMICNEAFNSPGPRPEIIQLTIP